MSSTSAETSGRVAVAGWYPDPYGRRRERWWDGGTWSAYARDTDEVEWDDEPLRPVDDEARPPALPGFGVAIAGFVAGVAAAFLAPRLVGDDHQVLAQVVSSAGLWLGLLGACGVTSSWRGTGSIVEDFGFRFRWLDVGIGLGASLAGRFVAVAAMAPLPLPSSRLRDLGTDFLPAQPPGPAAILVIAAIVCIGAPVVEELFFRGLIQPRLVERFGGVPGVIVTSLLFGAAHLIGWAGAISLYQAWAIAAAGLVLGYLREATGRLGPAIMAHLFFNAQVVALVLLLG